MTWIFCCLLDYKWVHVGNWHWICCQGARHLFYLGKTAASCRHGSCDICCMCISMCYDAYVFAIICICILVWCIIFVQCMYVYVYIYIYILWYMVWHMIWAMARRWGLHGEGQFLGLGGPHRRELTMGRWVNSSSQSWQKEFAKSKNLEPPKR